MRVRKRIKVAALAAFLMGVAALGVTSEKAFAGEAQIQVGSEDVSDGLLMYGGMLKPEENDVPSLGAYSDEAGAKAEIMRAWDNCEESCDLESYHLPVGDVVRVYTELLNEHPEYFYVSGSFRYRYKNGIIYSLVMQYEYNTSEIKTMKYKYQSAIKRALSDANTAWSDMEKVLYINDYLARNCEYDESLQKYDAYNMLVEKTAVCQGYALAVKALADELGLQCQLVTSVQLNHAWNIVRVNGSYYMWDCTWNDPTPDMMGQVFHNYLLKSTYYFKSYQGGHQASDYKLSGSWSESWANNTTYDSYFWDDIISGFDKIGGCWYAFDGTDSINSYICNGTDMQYQQDILNLSGAKWYEDQSSYYYYTGMVRTGCKDGMLYYSLPITVNTLNVNTGAVTKQYELSASELQMGYIYGVAVQADGSVKIEISNSPKTNGTIVTVEQPDCAVGHSYETIVTPAGIKQTGSAVTICSVCQQIAGNKSISAVKSLKLSTTKYTYNGKSRKPSVVITDSAGKKLVKGTDYTVKYASSCKNVGAYTAKVTFRNNYEGAKTLSYTIVPKGTTISKLLPKKKGFALKWKKQAKQTTGYEVQYSLKKNFPKKQSKTLSIGKNKIVSRNVTKLKANKKYYVRIRTYRTIKQKGKVTKLYSEWSKTKTIRTKK